MKKFWKSTILFFLSLSLLLGAVSCAPKEQEKGEEIVYSNDYLVKDGVSDYTVVIPETPDDNLLMAAEELSYFVQQITGAKLPIVSDAGLTYSENACYMSLGETSLAKDAGISATFSEMEQDGYYLKKKGKSVFVFGGSTAGTLNGVYDFLEFNLGVKMYAEDEIRLEKQPSVRLIDFNKRYAPPFMLRSIGDYHFNYNAQLRRRAKQQLRGDGWIYSSHSHFFILPPAEYREEHPDWYSPTGKQLCMSNMEMADQFALNVIELFKNDTEAKYCMLGIEDLNNSFCTCDKCRENIELYGMGGINVRFTNYVSRKLQAWIAENQPGREVMLFCYAYLDTMKAPVRFNEETKEYEVLDPSVIPDEQVGVMIAPYTYSYTYDLWDEDKNSAIAEILKGWQATTKHNMYMYLYGGSIGASMLFFDDFGSIKTNYEKSQEMGAIGIFHLLVHSHESSAFMELRSYVMSQLQWNIDQDVDDLVDDFMVNYFKTASDSMKKYYDLQRMHYAYLDYKFNISGMVHTTASAAMLDPKYWEKSYLDKCEEVFEQAYRDAEKLKETDPEAYAKVVKRILKEEMGIRFLLMEYYSNQFVKSDLLAEIDSFERDCAKLGIYTTRNIIGTEGTLIDEYILKWRTRALNMSN